MTNLRPDRTSMSQVGIMVLDPGNRKLAWRSVAVLHAMEKLIHKEERQYDT